MVYERLLQCMWRGMRGFDFSGIHAGMPLLFSGDLSGGTAVGRFRTGFSGTAGRGFFSFLVVGRGCLPDRGRKVGSSKKHICKKGEAFSFIFMDPPYGKLLEKEVLLFLEKSSLCDSETRIIVEADLETDFSYLEETDFHIIKQKKYKTNQHIFIGK